MCRIVSEIQPWLEDILSKVMQPDLRRAGVPLLVLLQCSNPVMATCNLDPILVLHPSITCLSKLMLAILSKMHLVGTRRLPHKVSRQLQAVVMTTMVNNRLNNSRKPMVEDLALLITLVTITVNNQLLDIINKGKVTLRMAMVVGIRHLLLNLVMVSSLRQFQDMISSKVIIRQLVTVMWPTQHKRGTLHPMDLKGRLVKPQLLSSHQQLASKDTPPSSPVQVLQVTHLRDLINQLMECPQLPKLVMGVNHQPSLGMARTMERQQQQPRSHQPTHQQFTGKPNSPLVLREVMVSPPLCSLPIHILSSSPLLSQDMVKQILVRSGLHHPVMELQLVSQVMEHPHLTVLRK